jgi:hypothetical protein
LLLWRLLPELAQSFAGCDRSKAFKATIR